MSEREYLIGKTKGEKIERQVQRGRGKLKGKFEFNGRERRINEEEITK